MVTTSTARRFVDAIVARDHDALRACLSPDVDFKGLTPGRVWEGTGPDDVVEAVFGSWFGPSDTIERVVDVAERDPVADTAHVSYRFDLANDSGSYVAEQQAYYRGGASAHGSRRRRPAVRGGRPRPWRRWRARSGCPGSRS